MSSDNAGGNRVVSSTRPPKTSPPYANPGVIDAFFERIPTLKDPGTVDAEWAKAHEIDPKQPTSVPAVLRWLGVTDNSYKTLDAKLWDNLRLPDTRAATLDRLVREAYSKIFDAVDIEQADRKSIQAVFVRAYALGNPRRNVSCFLALCSHAGIATKPGDRVPARKRPSGGDGSGSTPHVRASPHTPKPDAARKQPTAIPISLSVEIPADWTKDQITRRIADVQAALSEAGSAIA